MASWLLQIDWGKLFLPEMSLAEVLIRGTFVYVTLVLLLRVILKRQAGKVALSDLLVISIVAGVCRNPLVRDAYSITDGLLVVVVVLFWSYAMDWLSYYVPVIHALLHPKPVPLVRDGVALEDNLRHELVTDHQLYCQLRRHGIRDLARVAEAWMEGDGQVSVIKKSEAVTADGPHDPTPPLGEGNGRGEYPRAENRVEAAAREVSYPRPAHGPVAGETTAEPEVGAFLQAAQKLQEKLAWHRERAAEHQQAVREFQRLLGRNGFHPARAGKSPRTKETAPAADEQPK
jgi:uncharacterized membrane protein YcaP (DUF421 family)